MPKIFISYRRDDEDAQQRAIEIWMHLTQRFGHEQVFMDRESLVYGEDYRARILAEVEQSNVQLVVMGPRWLEILDERARQPGEDFVVLEVSMALQRGVKIIPLAVDGTAFPLLDQLPEAIKPLGLTQGQLLPDKARDLDFIAALDRVIQQSIVPLIDQDYDFVQRFSGGATALVGPVCQVGAASITLGAQAVQLAPYAIGRYPVTVGEYQHFLQATKHPEPPAMGEMFWSSQMGHPKRPVVNVSWSEATIYAAWLADITGQLWRLPTEAEWEYAARGTTTWRYPWGDTFAGNRCNTAEHGLHGPTDVGKFTKQHDASPCGAHDMAGNVWEWTASTNEDYASPNYLPIADTNVHSQRVHRGGSWKDSAEFATTTRRLGNIPEMRRPSLGFRLAIGTRPGR